MSYWSRLFLISFQLKGKSALSLLDDGLSAPPQIMIDEDNEKEGRHGYIDVGPRGS